MKKIKLIKNGCVESSVNVINTKVAVEYCNEGLYEV